MSGLDDAHAIADLLSRDEDSLGLAGRLELLTILDEWMPVGESMPAKS